MIRRDYFMRMIQELTQALARVLFLRQRQEYDQALREIDGAVAKFWDVPSTELGTLRLEELIAACQQDEDAVSEKLLALGDLLQQRGELLALKQESAASLSSQALALGLYLETLLTGSVSLDVMEKVEALAEATRGTPRSSAVLERLFRYFEVRGRWAQAEDALFDWLESGSEEAKTRGRSFYEQLTKQSDEDLAQGDLPRNEVEEGRREFLRRCG